MFLHIVLMSCVSLALGDVGYMNKKLCKDVDSSLCRVHNVIMDPCPEGPAFCVLKRMKSYGITLDMTPFFSAQKLKIAINGDVANDNTFATPVKTTADACAILTCPLEAEQRRIFDVNFVLDKRASGKFPLKVKLWNEDDESQSCCFTFNVKVK